MASKDPITGPTTGARVRGFIYYAFAISIIVHFVVGPLLPHFEQRHEQEKVEKVSVEKKIIVKVKPTPPPTPPPTPTPPPPKATPTPQEHKQTPAPEQPKLKINTVKTSSESKEGPSEHVNQNTEGNTQGIPQSHSTAAPVAAPPAPSAPPAPTPTPKPACAVPNAPPSTVQAAPADTPDIARQQGATGTVHVTVTLSETNKILNVKIGKSSGFQVLDQAAMQVARQSKFQTEIDNCIPVQKDYDFVVEYQQ